MLFLFWRGDFLISNFSQLLDVVKNKEVKIISVACAEDKEVLECIKEAEEKNIAKAILIGDRQKIEKIASEIKMDLSLFEVIDEKDYKNAALKAVEMIKLKKADMIMKGLIETKIFLQAILNKEYGLRTGKLMSHVAMFEVGNLKRLIFLSDAAFNLNPSLSDKVDIVNNAVTVAKSVGIENPKVAAICAVEVVNENMKATLDAAALSKMNDRGQIKGCLIDGPLALDNAISLESAKHKNIISEVAGQADILLMPSIEAGNVMYKTLTYMTNSKCAGILVGTSAPVIITSRSDSSETKLYSIALASLISEENNKM